ncbi:MAG: CoA transferase [Lachnospiraceae bacterium]|nr:CoA transferase [Lachnospiraceae bacterium]
MERPLEGIRVLDLARVLSGPHCAMLLGDLGAEVIKVEKPNEGDMTRSNPPEYNGESTYFMAHNRNKKGITLNFRKPQARELFLQLVKTADVVIENFRAGTMEKMGLGYDVLHEANPKIILTRISGYGQTGPYASRGCFDGAAQAMSGMVEITGDPQGSPYMTGTYIIDYASALYAAIGTLAALRTAERTGEGQVVDVALLDAAVSLLHTAVPDYMLLGQEMTRNGNNDRYMWPANIYPAKEGRWVYIHAGMEHCYKAILKEMGRMEVLEDERHGKTREARSTPEGRRFNDEMIRTWTMAHTANEIVERLSMLGIPCAKVNTIGEAMEDPQLRHRGMLAKYCRKNGEEGILAGSVPHFSGSEFAIELPPPSLGEHNEAVYAELGLSREEIACLKDDDVI